MLTRPVAFMMAFATSISFSAACSPAQPAADETRSFSAHPDLAGLPERWAALMDDLYVPGAGVAVIDDGAVYIETFGHRDAQQSLPVNADTMFYIGSITKTYTTAGLMRLEQVGEISLEDRVLDHIEGFELSDPDIQEAIRIRDLLTHRYGINASVAEVRLQAYTGEYTQDRFLEFMRNAFVSGQTDYGNEHFEIAGRIIEAVTGRDWRLYLEDALLEPAGLDRTTGFASQLWSDENAADPLLPAETGYRRPDQLKTDRTMHPAGGLGTSLNDAVRFLQLHMNEGVLDGEQLLPRDRVEATMTLHELYPEPEGGAFIYPGRTLGWQAGETPGGAALVVHGGGYSGALAWYAMLPASGDGVVFMMNANGPAVGWYQMVVRDLIARLTGEEADTDPRADLLRQIEAGALDNGTPIAPAPPPEAISAMSTEGLSLPVGLYEGYFHSEQLGTLVVEACEARLCFRLGDAPIPVDADGEDAFRITGFIRSTGRFVVSSGDEVNTVVIEADGESFGRHEFRR